MFKTTLLTGLLHQISVTAEVAYGKFDENRIMIDGNGYHWLPERMEGNKLLEFVHRNPN